MLEELMVPEYHHMFISLIGIDCYGGLTAQELEAIRNSLPNDIGGDIVRYALIRLGDPCFGQTRARQLCGLQLSGEMGLSAGWYNFL